MTGLNQKTTTQIETIELKTDAIIAELQAISLNTANTNDNAQNVIAAIQSLENAVNTNTGFLETLVNILTTVRDDTAFIRTNTLTTSQGIEAFDQAVSPNILQMSNDLAQLKQLTADFIAPQLENIFFAANGIIDVTLSTACLCEPGDPFPPPLGGNRGDNNIHCQRTQAFLAQLEGNLTEALTLLAQGGRVTTAVTATLVAITLASGATATPITGTASIAAAIAAVLGSTAEFKLQVVLTWLQENTEGLRQALFAATTATAAQAAWYTYVDANQGTLSSDELLIIKAFAWAGAINVLYDTALDIGEGGYDGSICAPPPPAWTVLPAVRGAQIRRQQSGSGWEFNSFTGNVYPLPTQYALPYAPEDPSPAYRIVDYPQGTNLPPDGSLLQDYPISLNVYWNKLSTRLRFRVPLDEQGTARLVRYNNSDPNPSNLQNDEWTEAESGGTYEEYFIRQNPTGQAPNFIQVQRWNGSDWVAL